MADTNDLKTEELKEEETATEENPETAQAPATEEKATPEAETPTDSVEPQTESTDEENTNPETVEEQIGSIEANQDTTNDDQGAEAETVEVNENPEEKEEVKTPEEESVDTTEETKEENSDINEEPETKPAQDQTALGGKKDPNIPDEAKWFIVHTYAGHENKVARNLKQRVESMGFEGRIFDIIVPTRETIKVSQGRKETVQEKIFPGYVIIRMVLDDESWLLVRTTQGVTAFIGAGNKPTPISEKEVEAIQKFMQMDEPLYKASFSVGEAVKIVDGPFADFLGTIDAIDEARGKIKVLVSIFGRETPVELDFLQAQKL